MSEESTPAESQVSPRFGRYELLYRFASGGMADLYLARLTGEEGFERLVAIKVIHEHLTRQPQFVKMFIDEARLASHISHPNVALTLELGRVGSKHFIAMEYVDGESLAALLRRTRPPLNHAARIISDAAAGLHAAHEIRGSDGELLGVVHRDVSPQNILISYDGGVKVVDFGVARARGSMHTTSGEIKGKFGYMSPEQFSAPESVDRRTDLFALGILLYETTTRTRLFKAPTESESAGRVLFGKITPPSNLMPAYPADLERIVMRALRRDPARRFQTAQEMHDDLERFIVASGEPVSSMTIATMMRGIFSDHIQSKRTLLEERHTIPPDEETVPAVDLVSGSSADMLASFNTGSTLGSFQPRRRWPTAAVVVLLVAVAAGAGLFLTRPLWTRASESGQVRGDQDLGGRRIVAPPDAAVQETITITAAATPKNATLLLAGKKMSNPFEIKQPAQEGVAELLISAPGYLTQRLEVPLAKGGTWTVGLAPEAQPKVKARKRPRRKQKKRKKGYLDNPYK